MKRVGRKVLPVLAFLAILVPNSTIFAGTTTITNNETGAISDNSCIDRTFDMVSSVIVTDVKIEVNIDHTYRADLDITLSSPSGTLVNLTSDNGGSADNLYVQFDDDAAISIGGDTSAQPPTVERRPEQLLNAFDGEDAQGVWTLQICDDANQDTGTFNYAVLDINDTPPPQPTIGSNLSVNLQMDECYWLDNIGGIVGDVKDFSPYGLDATSYGSAFTQNIVSQAPLCKAGVFNGSSDYLDMPDNAVLTTTNNYSIEAWIKPNTFTQSYEFIAMKTTDYVDGFSFYIYWDGTDSNIGEVVLLTGDGTNRDGVVANINANVWTHVVATYDGSMIRMYVNGSVVGTKAFAANILNATTPLVVGAGLNGNYYYDGEIDEVKLYNRTLSETDINTTYNNEKAGLNYDGTSRTCNICNANIAAHAWELVSIPAELRTSTETVNSVFADDMLGTYGTDWIVYRRDYSESNNSSWNTQLSETDILEFGKGYWLGSKNTESWNVNDIGSVDYNSSNNACTANRCVEVDLKSVSLDSESGDDLLGTGAHRYNMTGFVGKTAVDWADCRFIIDGTAYTPSAAYEAGYVEKQIWQYNPGDGSADANGYTTCDDTTPGGCKLEPYKGFWIKLHGPSKNKTVKLLIPQE